MTDLFESFGSQPIILDGGFGTSLEQLFQLDISDTPLWSAKAVVDHSDTVIQTHLAFLHAGADVISTSTYQCSYSTFESAGYSAVDAKRIMCQSVALASQARRTFCEEQIKNGNSSPRDVWLALSLGPYGASLKPAQEFDGFYPPPFGPKAYSQNSAAENYNTFGDDEAAEAESICALTQFHFERLLMIFEDESAWDSIDSIAFETVPLTREIKAIRQAMGLLDNRIATIGSRRSGSKPWWISVVFPSGIYPEMTKDGLSRMTAQDIVFAAAKDESPRYPCPSALGINCTQVEYLPGLVSQFEDGLKTLRSEPKPKPWLVLYPNGGDIYNPITQTWLENGSQNSEKQWARTLTASYTSSDTWAGVIFGGCCQATPTHIRSLVQIVHSKV